MLISTRLQILVAASLLLHTLLMSQPLDSLQMLRWENRILFIHASGQDVNAVKTTLEEAKSGIDDRDIAWFILGKQPLATNYSGVISDELAMVLKQRFFPGEPDGIEIVLIGKDGGKKAIYSGLDLEAIYARIDSMPMRQAEMRNRR